MEIISFLLVMLGAAIAAAPILIGRKPGVQPFIERLRPFQGVIGVMLVILGIIYVIQLVPLFGWVLETTRGALMMALVVIGMLAIGFLLGYELIIEYTMKKNPEAQKKAAEIRRRLTPVQGGFGIASMIIALLLFLF